jgi:bifunctional ADP-heptose synthase (sugar kinase/adenylyltransferase)
MADVEISGGGGFQGTCPENAEIALFKGGKVGVYAGGVGNVCNLLTANGATVDLFCDGGGSKDKAWIQDLVKRTLRCNRVHFSGEGAVSLKLRGLCDNQVVSRIDCDEITQRKRRFVALEALADDCDRYQAIIISDYCKGLVSDDTEEAIRKIIKRSKISVVDSKRMDYSLWNGATAIVPNLAEAARIYSTIDPLEIVLKAGVGACYITRSGESVLWSDGKVSSEIEVDQCIEHPYSVGSGDAFAAGLAMSLAKGETYIKAGQAGVKLAQAYSSRPRKCNIR